MKTVVMEFSRSRPTLGEAKNIDIIQYLAGLGLEPVKVRNNDYWYHSPFRDEKTPSFKVNRKLNLWYDHGLGKGGNLIDFAIRYYDCTLAEFLAHLKGDFLLHQPLIRSSTEKNQPENPIRILDAFELSSYALVRYLQERRIPVEIAAQYCREVRYELNNKIYYGIGFKNDKGGYEIRNPYFKASSSPKGITSMDNHANEVIVFEGFTDFLSFKAIHTQEPENRFDFVVLNSLSLFETARPFMEKHKEIKLYLDRDANGQNCSRYALSISAKYKDESSLYQNHKDINDWVMNMGKPEKQQLRHRLR